MTVLVATQFFPGVVSIYNSTTSQVLAHTYETAMRPHSAQYKLEIALLALEPLHLVPLLGGSPPDCGRNIGIGCHSGMDGY